MMLLVLLPTALLPQPRPPPVTVVQRRAFVGGIAAALLPPRPALADTVTFEALLKTLVDSPRKVELVDFTDSKGNTAYAVIGGSRLDITGIPPDTPLQTVGPLKLAAVCRDQGVPFKFSALEGFGKERLGTSEAVPVEYAKFVATVKQGVEGVVFESGGKTAIALTGEGNTMLRTEVKASWKKVELKNVMARLDIPNNYDDLE